MPTPTPEQSSRRIERYRDDLTNTSTSATIARQLLTGDWLTPSWLERHIRSSGNRRTLAAQVVSMFEAAGFAIERKQDQPSSMGGKTSWRLASRPEAGKAPGALCSPTYDRQPFDEPLTPQVVETPATQPNPALGMQLQVRALALSDDGVQLQLSDGNGNAWLCLITGYLAPVKVQ